jgi:anti-sigma factor RsiW
MSTTSDIPDVACIELVELVTDYLDAALTDADRIRFEHHVDLCPGCAEIVAQFRAVITTTGSLRPEDAAAVPAATREELLGIFRAWRSERD